MKVYAALHEDIAQGFVWLKLDGLPNRGIVKITNEENGRKVFCEALGIDSNFLHRYNEGDRRRKIENSDSAIVMNQWFRAKLGSSSAPLETQGEYRLRATPANFLWGRLRACLQHPQLAIRLSTWLSILGTLLGFLGLMIALGASRYENAARAATVGAVQGKPNSKRVIKQLLTAEEVLRWRDAYKSLLDLSRDALLERFGHQDSGNEGLLTWDRSLKTGDRQIMVSFDKHGKVASAAIFRRDEEELPVSEILKHTRLFTFDTSENEDGTTFFLASTMDKGNHFEFDLTPEGVEFAYLLIVHHKLRD